MALILCAGALPNLMATRKLILERAGHTVVPAIGEDAVIAACKVNTFDLAVISQTIRNAEKEAVFGTIRQQCPKAKILELYRQNKILPEADDWLEVPADVPSDLEERVSAMLARTTPK